MIKTFSKSDHNKEAVVILAGDLYYMMMIPINQIRFLQHKKISAKRKVMLFQLQLYYLSISFSKISALLHTGSLQTLC